MPRMNFNKNIGMLILAIFLICFGIARLGVPLGIVPAVLALIAGILILIGR